MRKLDEASPRVADPYGSDDGMHSEGESLEEAGRAVEIDLNHFDDDDELPTRRRRCTDWGWIPPFAAVVAALTYVACQPVPGADAQRLWRMADSDGRLCGQGVNAGKNYMFLCKRRDPGGVERDVLYLGYRACRETCPNSSETSFLCKYNVTTEGNGTQFKSELMPDYPTFEWLDAICRPEAKSLIAASRLYKLEHPNARIWLFSDTVGTIAIMAMRAWMPIAICALWSFIACMGYIVLLKNYAGQLVWIGLMIMSVVPFLTGVALIYRNQYGFGDLKGHQTDLVVGVVLLLFGVMVAGVACNQGEEVELAISCIEWSCKCITCMPGMLLEPMLMQSIRCSSLALQMPLLFQIVSCFMQDMTTVIPEDDDDAVTERIGVILVFFIIGNFWLQNCVTAASDFVVFNATMLWYFEGGMQDETRVSNCLPLRSYYTVHRYHWGTVIYGSLVTSVIMPFRQVLSMATAIARLDRNPVGQLMNLCCGCVVQFYENNLEFLGGTAYLETSMSGAPFWIGAHKTNEVSQLDGDTVHVLNGATRIFQMIGMVGIVIISHAGCNLLVYHGMGFDFLLPDSPYFVHNVEVECIIASVAAGLVAWPYMLLFDKVSDAILYCHIVDKHRTAEEEMEESSYFGQVSGYFGRVAGCTCGFGGRPKQSMGGPGYLFSGNEEEESIQGEDPLSLYGRDRPPTGTRYSAGSPTHRKDIFQTKVAKGPSARISSERGLRRAQPPGA